MTQTAPPDPAARELSALTGLAKLGLVLRRHRWQDRERSGLTPTQAGILAILRAAEEPLRLGEIARRLGVTAPTASDAVTRLTEKGLVTKRRAGRTLAASLTPSGQGEAEAGALWPDELLVALDTLDETERGHLLRVLTKMIRSLQEQEQIPVARMCAGCRFFRPFVHDDPRRPHHCAFTDNPFGDSELRLDCVDHEPSADRERLWLAYTRRSA